MRYKKRKKAASQVMTMAVVVVTVLAVLFVLASSQVFKVRNVLVVGNRNLHKEEVIAQSGVQIGDNLFSLSDAELKKRLEKNRYIEYVGHEFDYRGTLTLRINERLGMGVVNALGLYYVLDASGMVLECAGSTFPDTVAGPKISGFSMDDNTRVVVGDRLPVRDSGQLESMKRVLTTLDSVGLLGRIAQLDVKNLDNLYLMTTDGAKIVLGDDSDLAHTGFRTFLGVMDEYHPRYMFHGHVHQNYQYNFKRIRQHGDTTVINVFGYYLLDVPIPEHF